MDYARAVDAGRRIRGLSEDRAPKRTSNKRIVHETEPNDRLRYNNANHPSYPYSHWREALDVPDADVSSSSARLSSDGASKSSLSEDQDNIGAADKPTDEDSAHKGCRIEYDRRPAVINGPDLGKLRIVMFQKGSYKMRLSGSRGGAMR